MGQKVNPHGARVGVIYDWSTRWYAGKRILPTIWWKTTSFARC